MKKTRGTIGADHLIGKASADYILGLDGDDVIEGNGGDDTLKGGYGNDNVYGGNGNDKIFGDGGNDFLFGEAGDDVIKGGDGNDIIVGAAGADSLHGEAGNDRMFSITGDDRMEGGTGDDYYEIGAGLVSAWDISGNDEYVVKLDGNVTIEDTGGVDKLRVRDLDAATAILLNDMMFERQGDDLIITVDGHDGQTTLSLFYTDDKTHRIERIYDENADAPTGYSLQIEALLGLASGDSPVSGADLWGL